MIRLSVHNIYRRTKIGLLMNPSDIYAQLCPATAIHTEKRLNTPPHNVYSFAAEADQNH